MKKSSLILFASIIGCMALGVMSPLAASAVDETTGHIELEENDEKTKPVDPEDPSKELVPEDPYNPGQDVAGPLSLDVVPTSFEFGTQKMYSAAHTYAGQKQAVDHVRQYVQVSDNRDSGTYGWALSVKQDDYLKNLSHTLTGATISIPAGTARNSLNTPATDVDARLTTTAVDITNADKTVFATTKDDADPSVGKGQSTSVWTPDQVELMIPANTAKTGDYTNTLTWTLTAVVHS
ncbi:WxL domain-containing protein [Enterococcus sp. BWM-S5]|uniref:WxL domain-containing protein n=1 Tax=Enterococcus larvae TaxID=2794352 RepID=A0ABS4CK50_9ENTE|nr:WxL domain-containing protein [Enterococcus larvae]MBP1046981.1 WxL domain-containing protein [Enterococcus larvae]